MTDVATTLRSAYLAGPMRGIEEYNFPAFKKAAKMLRSTGWDIYSPAERDETDGVAVQQHEERRGDGDWAASLGLDYYMQFDLAAVSRMDAVICLPNWEASQGARLETMVAAELGHPVFELEPWSNENATHLRSVDPEYIMGIFMSRAVPDVDDFSIRVASMIPPPGGVLEYPVGMESAQVTNSDARKGVPLTTGVLDYFPAALAEVAKVSKAGNDKHNPGQPLHHARGKSTDHADALLRHLVDRGKVDEDTGQLHSAEVAWRALALLQQELEDAGAPLARGARLPEQQEDA